ncbi:FAD-binding protein [Cohnella hashimotonis]|uniref:FAD-binding protein n=1 Tax=Cohnella hashimotonis TaxID=2826895 RepID=A0ABT6TG09_9BACL|nr:FAD-binding protein [Cohnella hashimotonis]MDI4645233.1 FAD-binding protein [Cohnella hashimotonis]
MRENARKHSNWAGNYEYQAAEIVVPSSVEEIQELVAHSSRVKALGSRHSFNGIADTKGTQLSMDKLNRVIDMDERSGRVKVEGGIRYGELCAYLDQRGYALPNLASLPHITVAGACATATHGSGIRNGNLATSVHALDLVTANGDKISISRDDGDGMLQGAVVGLGSLGIVTAVTLEAIPAFRMSQTVYEGLALATLAGSLDEIFSAAYSVSLFTDWRQAGFNQVWLKRKEPDEGSEQSLAEPSFYGATRATERKHPVPGLSADPCSEQLGIVGRWYERLPHFRMNFTPSAGEELQSEYFVPRAAAYDALCAIERLRGQIAPLLYVSEIRTIAADELWMSPCYGQDAVGIHFTWKPEQAAVSRLLPLIEEALAPFRARPHWAKLHVMNPALLRSLYEKLPDFQQLAARLDPNGKFRNAYTEKYLLGADSVGTGD